MTAFTKTPSRQFPTRLRLRFPGLRRAPWACAQVGAALRQIDGVVSVEASAAVGSVLVIYHVAADAEHALLERLQAALAAHGLACDGAHQAAHAATHAASYSVNQGAAGPGRSASERIAGKFAGTVVERLVERSAMALVAALF